MDEKSQKKSPVRGKRIVGFVIILVVLGVFLVAVANISNRLVTSILVILLIIVGGYFSVSAMLEIKRWGEALEESKRRFRTVLENSQDVVYQLDRKKGEYVYMSPTKGMIGYDVEEILKQGPQFIYERTHPEDLIRLEKEVDEVYDKKSMDEYSRETEFRVKTKSGEYIWVDNKRSVIRDEDGSARYIVGNVRNINERKKNEQKIDDSLKEKEVLLQEIHHRVKNNLAVISGLLYLQKQELDEPAKSAFENMESRINSVAMIHEKLYGSDSLSNIDLAEYIEELTDGLQSTNSSDNIDVQLQKELQPIKINIQSAVSFGLVVNELVTNAYKHAFNGRKEGVIKVTLKGNGAHNVLTVEDDGPGLPDDFMHKADSALGLSLVHTLLGQMDADIEINNNGLTQFKIIF